MSYTSSLHVDYCSRQRFCHEGIKIKNVILFSTVKNVLSTNTPNSQQNLDMNAVNILVANCDVREPSASPII